MLRIEVDNLRIGGRVLCEEMCLEVPRSSLHLLSGPNGCGKSLLLDVVTGVAKFPGVNASIGKDSLRHKSSYGRWRKGLRRLYQQPVIPTDITVEIALQWFIRAGNANLKLRLGNLLSEVGIPRDSLLGQLSYGQRRFVELCCTVSSGEAILLDEPFAGLEPAIRIAAQETIQESAEHGKSFLIVDHTAASSAKLYTHGYSWPSFPSENENDLNTLCDPAGREPELQRVDGVSLQWEIAKLQIDNKEAVKDSKIRLASGEIAIIEGGNGSGKSTLLRALGSVSQPWPNVDSVIVGHPCKDQMFLSPQPPKLVSEMSVEDNLRLMICSGAKIEAGVEEKIKAALELLAPGLSGIYRNRAEVLSGGESACVALVGAIYSGSPVLLLDEPFESMTEGVMLRSLGLLCRALVANRSVLIVTHRFPFSMDRARLATIRMSSSRSWSGSLIGTSSSSFSSIIWEGAK